MTTDLDQELVALARLSPAGLAVLDTHHAPASERWVLYRYLRLLAERLMSALNAGRNFMCAMPPRHGKSLLVSVYLPAWFMLTWPTRNVILTSYGEDLACGFSQRAMQLVSRWGHLWGVRLSKKTRAAKRWAVEYLDEAGEWQTGGEVIAAGIGGPLPGRGFDLGIMDDVVKSLDDCTPAGLERTRKWYHSVFANRAAPGAVQVLVMTRWHIEDLAGHLLTEAPDEWDTLALPALAEVDDPLGREPGEALCPDRYPRDVLLRKRDSGGDESGWLFESLYQCNPRPTGGAVWQEEHFRHYEEREAQTLVFDEYTCLREQLHGWFAVIDPALKDRERHCETGFLVCALNPRRDLVIVEDRSRQMAGTTHLIPECKAIQEKYRTLGGIRFYVESAAHGLEVMRALEREGVRCLPLKADRDKVTRAYAALPAWQAGRVWHPKRAPWLAKFENQLLGFPGARLKDRADVAAYAGHVWQQYSHGSLLVALAMESRGRGQSSEENEEDGLAHEHGWRRLIRDVMPSRPTRWQDILPPASTTKPDWM